MMEERRPNDEVSVRAVTTKYDNNPKGVIARRSSHPILLF